MELYQNTLSQNHQSIKQLRFRKSMGKSSINTQINRKSCQSHRKIRQISSHILENFKEN